LFDKPIEVLHLTSQTRDCLLMPPCWGSSGGLTTATSQYNAANNVDLRHAPDILNTELHSSQKQSKTTSSVGLETIELSDLVISIGLSL